MKLLLMFILIISSSTFAEGIKNSFSACTIFTNSTGHKGIKSKVAGFMKYKCDKTDSGLSCLIYKDKERNVIFKGQLGLKHSSGKDITYNSQSTGARAIISGTDKKIVFQLPYKTDVKGNDLSILLCRGALKRN
jgi:hypothetical protein